MGSSVPTAPSPEFLASFLTEAGETACLRFDQFMAMALYHPQVGYYRGERQRVGRGGQTDFYTASSSGQIFGELVTAAVTHLLPERSPRNFEFVEIGAEPGGGILRDVAHPFASTREIRVGEAVNLTGNCIVFSNELFDAQPCRRFVRRGDEWREAHVAATEGRLAEIEIRLDADDPIVRRLPAHAPDGYRFDTPLAAVTLAQRIAEQPWRGLFLAFDYGKSWTELAEATPQGTARAYHRHQQMTDLLAQPGCQDLTCHVCWDWLTDALRSSGFQPRPVMSQEAFLVRYAGEFLALTMAAEARAMSQRKLALMQLLHPGNLGQKFQALSAWRASAG